MTRLEPCPHCHRHVKIDETACPFCAGSLADAFAELAPRAAPGARIGRAATLAFGLLASTQGACFDKDTTGTPTVDAAPSDSAPTVPHDGDMIDAYDGSGTPIYAAAPTFDGSGRSRG